MNPIRALTVAVIVLFVTVGIIGVLAARTASQNKEALCTFTSDLEDRLDRGKEFIEAHPKGALGLSPEFIKNQLDNQQRTLDSLDSLNCD